MVSDNRNKANYFHFFDDSSFTFSAAPSIFISNSDIFLNDVWGSRTPFLSTLTLCLVLDFSFSVLFFL